MTAKRVGSVTLGLTLVVFGVMFLLSAFIKSFNYLDVINSGLLSLYLSALKCSSTPFQKTRKSEARCSLVHHDLRAHALSMCLAGAQYAMTELVPYIQAHA